MTPAPSSERPFTSLAELCARLRWQGLTWPAAEAIVWSGACDTLAPKMPRRQRLWHLHELWPLLVGKTQTRPQSGKGRRRRGQPPAAEQLPLAWEETLPGTGLPLLRADGRAVDVCASARENVEAPTIPHLPALSAEERAALDYQLLGLSARPHPMCLLRRDLRRQGIQPIAALAEVPAGRVVRVAGWPISAQRPPTAKGMGFLVLEDETGRLPIACPPRLAAELHRRLRGARAVIVVGRVERVRWYRSLLAFDFYAPIWLDAA